jgi:hypothetical protein
VRLSSTSTTIRQEQELLSQNSWMKTKVLYRLMDMLLMTSLIKKRGGENHIGYLAHARPKFMDAQKARGKNKNKIDGAKIALKFIKGFYGIEKMAK